jgi:hypothetical protein
MKPANPTPFARKRKGAIARAKREAEKAAGRRRLELMVEY